MSTHSEIKPQHEPSLEQQIDALRADLFEATASVQELNEKIAQIQAFIAGFDPEKLPAPLKMMLGGALPKMPPMPPNFPNGLVGNSYDDRR